MAPKKNEAPKKSSPKSVKRRRRYIARARLCAYLVVYTTYYTILTYYTTKRKPFS